MANIKIREETGHGPFVMMAEDQHARHTCPLFHQGTIDRSSPLSTTAPVSSHVSLDCFAMGTSLRKNVARMVAAQKTSTAIKPCWMATASESLSASNT